MTDLMTSIGDLLGLNKGKGTIAAADLNDEVLKGLKGEISNLITKGDNRARGYLDDNLALTSLGPNAKGILGDIYGLNGDAGHARALDAFHTAPGYDFQMDQGLQALDRRAASAGRFSSGNADLDTLRFSQGLADDSWSNWVNGLTGGIDRQIGANGDLAGLSRDVTGQRINLAGDIGSGQLNTNNQRAAGQEAGQGAIWDLFNNIAGVAGSAFGLNKNGGQPGGAPASTGQQYAFGGYGRY